MTRYNGPNSVGSKFNGSFVRAVDVIAIGEPGAYVKIAEAEGILTEPNSIPTTEKDAGLLYVQGAGLEGLIVVAGQSSKLGLPETDGARLRTQQVLERLSPGYEVLAQPASVGPSPERR